MEWPTYDAHSLLTALGSLSSIVAEGFITYDCNFNGKIFKFILCIIILSTSCDNVFRWTPQNTFDDNSTLAQVVALCY